MEFTASPEAKEAKMLTLSQMTLSTGKSVTVGIHCFSTYGFENQGALTEAERDEAWDLVNAKLAAYRATK